MTRRHRSRLTALALTALGTTLLAVPGDAQAGLPS
jgi:hypothetical protein